MDFETHVIFSLTAGAGALTGWIRIRKTDPAFFSFTLLLTAGFVTEITSLIVIKNGFSNAIYSNLFVFVEALLVTRLFYRLGLFRNRQKYLLLQFFYSVIWVSELLYRWQTAGFLSYFIVCYSSILVFQAIDLLHVVLFQTPHKLYMNPVFLICMGFIVYFTFSIIVEIFWFFGLNHSSAFRIRVYEVFSYINLFTNILFILATLWIPLKREYILRSFQ